MCGIVGLFLKDKSLESSLGALLTDMLVTMSDRGPDSAGVAIYGDEIPGKSRLTVQSEQPDEVFADLGSRLSTAIGSPVDLTVNATHATLSLDSDKVDAARKALGDIAPDVRVMGRGTRIEIYKEVGLPEDVAARFHLSEMHGSHGIGHTRMATESVVTTLGAHPFNTGDDQCLVHNGSLSNHNALRRKLARHGLTTETLNDTEVAAAYLTWRMREGDTLGEALEHSLNDLDGFYTFVVGTKDGFGVLRDPIACKPAVMAETDRYIAFGSEYRALVNLPDIDKARVWEPEPATVYFWSH